MKVPRYWAKGISPASGRSGRPMAVSCWRWSDLSLQDAQRNADVRAMELARLFETGRPLDRYGYGEQPLREEIVQILQADAAIVTRNLYGALVLNTSGAMFIDLDFAPGGNAPRAGGLLSRLLGKPAAAGPEKRALEHVREWGGRRSDLGLRVYRTNAGLRCMVTNRNFEPSGPETLELLRDIGSDPLYVRLCQAQACFRARLTPKPWRCGARNPPSRYPWTSAESESRFRRWQSDYERLSLGYCVCRFVEQAGRGEVHPEIQPILALHDQVACARPDRPLA